MTGPDDLPGDDADYDDLNELEAIGLGILQELTLIRQELQVQRADVSTENVQEADPELMCECGETFNAVPEARAHAVYDHDAPREGNAWRRLYRGDA